jgi:hypothetical protein
MPHPDFLIDVALSAIHRRFPSFTDAASLQEIKSAFALFIQGRTQREAIAALLRHYFATIQPLELVLAILHAPDIPPTLQSRDDQFDARTASRRKPRPWSPAEDTRLLAGVYRYGCDNWTAVAEFVGNGRVRAQCAQRWTRGLNPRISKDLWSDEEDQRFLALVHAEGTKTWTKIASEMGNRSDVQCRYHFAQLQRDGKVGKEFNQSLAEKADDTPRAPQKRLNARRSSPVQSRSVPIPPAQTSPPVPLNPDKTGVHAMRLGDRSEAIDWSIQPEDDNEQGGIFGDRSFW